MSKPVHINSIQWQQAVDMSRQTCARVFRDGGAPGDAVASFGLEVANSNDLSWEKAVDQIAAGLCAQTFARAA